MSNRLKLRLFSGTIYQSAPPPDPEAPPVAPSAAWGATGQATSGYGAENPIPTQGAVSIGTPVAVVVWPARRFAANMPIDVVTFDASLVRLHFEGNVYDETVNTLRTYTDVNGISRKLPSYRFMVDHGACLALHASGNTIQYYVEIFPSNPALSTKLYGPYKCYPEATLYDGDLTVDTTQPVAGTNFHSIIAALNHIRVNTGMHNNRIRLMNDGDTYPITGRVTPAVTNRRGHTFIMAAAGQTATIGNTSETTWANSAIRPYFDGLSFVGEGLTVDYKYLRAIYNTGVLAHEYDGCNLTNSNGAPALTFGIVTDANAAGGAGPSVYHCNISGALRTITRGARVALNNLIEGTADDLLSSTTLAMGNELRNCNNVYYYRDKIPVMHVSYLGAGSATLAKVNAAYSNQSATSAATYVLTDPAGSVTLTTGNYDGARPLAPGTISKLCADINARAGWVATALVEPGDPDDAAAYVLSVSTAGRQAPFSVSVDAAGLDLSVSFDIHSDLYQATSGNRIFAYNKCWNIEAQLVFLSDQIAWEGVRILGNLMHADGTAPQDGYSSKITGENPTSPLKNFRFEHNVLIGQSFTVSKITGGLEVYIKNNVFSSLSVTTSTFDGAQISGNHHISGVAFPGATDETSGGSIATLFADAENGDFTPIGALASSLVTPTLPWDADYALWGATDARGGVRVPA